MKTQKKSAFTLVELIVVITILAVLATMGFLSLQGYTHNARESSRVSDIAAIMRAFDYYQLKHEVYPVATNATTITASGNIVGYQGNATKDILGQIGFSGDGKDPLDGIYYSYYVLADKSAIQMLAHMENPGSLNTYLPISKSHADLSIRYPKTFGKKLGILTDSGNAPIQDTIGTGSVDITQTSSSYTAHLDDSDKVTGTGSQLRQSVPRVNCKRIHDLSEGGTSGFYTIYPIDESPLEVYCNMEEQFGGLTLVSRSVDNPSFTNDHFGWFVSAGSPKDHSQPYSLGDSIKNIPFENVYVYAGAYTEGQTLSGALTVVSVNSTDILDSHYGTHSVAINGCDGAILGGGTNACSLFSHWGNFESRLSYFLGTSYTTINSVSDLNDLSQYVSGQRDGLNSRTYNGAFPLEGMIFVK